MVFPYPDCVSQLRVRGGPDGGSVKRIWPENGPEAL